MSNKLTRKMNGKADDDSSSTQPSKRPDTIWTLLTRARTVFKVQVAKTNVVKMQCIYDQIRIKDFPDKEMFWLLYKKQTNRLLDSVSYLKECEALKISAKNLAEHTVFSGSTKINEVLDKGVKSTFGEELILYVERLIDPKIAKCFQTEIQSVSNESPVL